MTHSYKHNPIFGTVGSKSSKWYKKMLHGQERARIRNLIAHGQYELAELVLAPWDAWDDPRDGKRWSWNFYPRAGFGIHNKWYQRWTKEQYDEMYEKAMRK